MRSQISILHRQEARINRGSNLQITGDRSFAVYAGADYLLKFILPQFEFYELDNNS